MGVRDPKTLTVTPRHMINVASLYSPTTASLTCVARRRPVDWFGTTERKTQAPNWWRMQGPGWAYGVALNAASARSVAGSPGAGCQPGFDLGLGPADGADSDPQRPGERPFAHLAVEGTPGKAASGPYFGEAQEAVGGCGSHRHVPSRALSYWRVQLRPVRCQGEYMAGFVTGKGAPFPTCERWTRTVSGAQTR